MGNDIKVYDMADGGQVKVTRGVDDEGRVYYEMETEVWGIGGCSRFDTGKFGWKELNMKKATAFYELHTKMVKSAMNIAWTAKKNRVKNT